MSKLEDRLKTALNKFYGYITERDIIKIADEYSNKRIPKEASEAIYKDLIELVPTGIKGCGELKPQPNDDTPGMIYAQAQNKFRAEFLQKLAEYCGVKE